MLLEGLDASSTRAGRRWDPPLRAVETSRAFG
jgi:hypothetical protein